MSLKHDEQILVDTASAPTENPDPDKVNSFLAKEMHQMSVLDRERAYEDLHGVSQVTVEKPDFVMKSLNDFQLALDRVRDKPAYEAALLKSPEYVKGKDLRVMFLRSTNFNIEKSVARFVNYFKQQQYFFGDETLGRPIRYSDLEPEAIKCLKSGFMQLLPFRDKSGRAVLWVAHAAREKRGVLHQLRANWYLTMAVVEDEETQKNGIVIIGSGIECLDFSQETRSMLWESSRLSESLPTRIVGFHACIEAKILSPLLSVAQIGANKDIRARNRVHFGTQTEWTYSLMTFGVPVEYIPISSSGKVKVKFHREWLARRCQLESGQGPGKNLQRKEIDLPGRNDILLGKGGPTQQYSGNVLFHQIVDKEKERYSKALKGEKKAIAQELYNFLINENNCRFLDRTKDGWWIEASGDAALKKISNRLRTKPTPTAPETSAMTPLLHAPNNIVDHRNDTTTAKSDIIVGNTLFMEEEGFSLSCCRPMGVAKRAKIERGTAHHIYQ